MARLSSVALVTIVRASSSRRSFSTLALETFDTAGLGTIVRASSSRRPFSTLALETLDMAGLETIVGTSFSRRPFSTMTLETLESFPRRPKSAAGLEALETESFPRRPKSAAATGVVDSTWLSAMALLGLGTGEPMVVECAVQAVGLLATSSLRCMLPKAADVVPDLAQLHLLDVAAISV